MKEIDLKGISYIQPLRWGTAEWYYGMDYPYGDLYEAEELFRDGRPLDKYQHLYFVHYPDGEVICPLELQGSMAFGEPVYCDQSIAFPVVDFAGGIINIYSFDCVKRTLDTAAELPLSSVKDCYNLLLHIKPLTLSRQPNDGSLELIWPERKLIKTGERETFFLREGGRLYFSNWYEDPDYREEIIVRSAESGEILEQMPGDIMVMPDGQLWHIK